MIEIIFPLLDMVLLERREDGSFAPLAHMPEWFLRLYPELAQTRRLVPQEKFLFLEDFLNSANQFWAGGEQGRITSGAWTEVDPAGDEWNLEASAICIEERRLLLIERARTPFEEKQSIVQKGRETTLDFRRAKRSQKELRKVMERYHALLEAIPALFFVFRNDGRVLEWKAGIQPDFVVQQGPYSGRKLGELLPSDLVQQILDTRLNGSESLQQISYGKYEVRMVASGRDEAVCLIF